MVTSILERRKSHDQSEVRDLRPRLDRRTTSKLPGLGFKDLLYKNIWRSIDLQREHLIMFLQFLHAGATQSIVAAFVYRELRHCIVCTGMRRTWSTA